MAVMSMPESRYHEARSEQTIAVRFRMKASSDEVVAHLFEAVRGTDLTLRKVFGDGDLVYPFEGGNPAEARLRGAQSSSGTLPPSCQGGGWRSSLKRAEIFLEVPGRVRLEIGGGQRNPREDVRGVRRAQLSGPVMSPKGRLPRSLSDARVQNPR